MKLSAASELLRTAGVMPVVTVADSTSAVAIARALAEGGLVAMEVTLRSPAALEAIGVIRREVPRSPSAPARCSAIGNCSPRRMPAPSSSPPWARRFRLPMH